MKKIIALALSAVLALSMVACGGSKNEAKYDVDKILSTIEEVAPVRMGMPVDEEYMTWLSINSEMYEDYAGTYNPTGIGVDFILVVLAKDGKTEDVKSALEAHRDYIATTNSNYVPVYTEAANAGRIVEKGNYVLLVMHSGDEETAALNGIDKVYEPIDAAIEKAFN